MLAGSAPALAVPPPPGLLQDLNRDVARIDTVPTQYLDTIKVSTAWAIAVLGWS